MAISRADRARQFLPFDALKGLNEALRSKEIEYEDRKDLSEEEEEKISNILLSLESGNNIRVKYYYKRQYILLKGIIKKIDPIKKQILFIDENIIQFNDIIEIEKI
ncbi:MAG: YolD-like family protein [Clostridia bacterium]|nr:YolD-like family protein [Clostridia bacterium]